MVFSLFACTDSKSTEQKPVNNSTQDQPAVNTVYPVPKKITSEDSKNKLGLRYVFTLEEYNTMLNDACNNLGQGDNKRFFDYENWEMVSDNLTDENGVEYASYSYITDVLIITAAVEKESKKVMNRGCGAAYEQFEDGGEDFQYNVILTASIIAMVAGGYEQDDLEFLYSIFYDSAQYKQGFFYHNNLYMIDYSKGESEDVSVVLFMTSPCNSEIQKQWELIDYTNFEATFEG